jgi:pyruvate dehydrogenase E2 component (dihydrolipoamide acetyltransferase)
MMFEVKMPKIGLTMEEGMIVKWYVKEGGRIKKGEPFFEIMTEKISFVVEATISGLVVKTNFFEEDVVKVGEVIAIVEVEEAGLFVDNEPEGARVKVKET